MPRLILVVGASSKPSSKALTLFCAAVSQMHHLLLHAQHIIMAGLVLTTLGLHTHLSPATLLSAPLISLEVTFQGSIAFPETLLISVFPLLQLIIPENSAFISNLRRMGWLHRKHAQRSCCMRFRGLTTTTPTLLLYSIK